MADVKWLSARLFSFFSLQNNNLIVFQSHFGRGRKIKLNTVASVDVPVINVGRKKERKVKTLNGGDELSKGGWLPVTIRPPSLFTPPSSPEYTLMLYGVPTFSNTGPHRLWLLVPPNDNVEKSFSSNKFQLFYFYSPRRFRVDTAISQSAENSMIRKYFNKKLVIQSESMTTNQAIDCWSWWTRFSFDRDYQRHIGGRVPPEVPD